MTSTDEKDGETNLPRTAEQTKKMTLTVEEVAERLGISRNTAYDGVKAGSIPALRFGKRIVIPVTQLNRLLAGLPMAICDDA